MRRNQIEPCGEIVLHRVVGVQTVDVQDIDGSGQEPLPRIVEQRAFQPDAPELPARIVQQFLINRLSVIHARVFVALPCVNARQRSGDLVGGGGRGGRDQARTVVHAEFHIAARPQRAEQREQERDMADPSGRRDLRRQVEQRLHQCRVMFTQRALENPLRHRGRPACRSGRCGGRRTVGQDDLARSIGDHKAVSLRRRGRAVVELQQALELAAERSSILLVRGSNVREAEFNRNLFRNRRMRLRIPVIQGDIAQDRRIAQRQDRPVVIIMPVPEIVRALAFGSTAQRPGSDGDLEAELQAAL